MVFQCHKFNTKENHESIFYGYKEPLSQFVFAISVLILFMTKQ